MEELSLWVLIVSVLVSHGEETGSNLGAHYLHSAVERDTLLLLLEIEKESLCVMLTTSPCSVSKENVIH